jgi:uncharacterized protein YlbG (UPF0298 family)
MSKLLIDLDDLQEALNELKTVKYVEPEMTPEMEASQKRYEEYIKKHANDN